MELIFVLIAITLMLWFYIFLPAEMAKKRDRSPLVWVCISFIFTPFVAIFGLLVLGRGVNGAM